MRKVHKPRIAGGELSKNIRLTCVCACSNVTVLDSRRWAFWRVVKLGNDNGLLKSVTVKPPKESIQEVR